MLQILRKYGFTVIESFFSTTLMDKINNILNTWDETDTWNNFAYSDFYSVDSDQLNMHKNRLEIALPFFDPFTTVLSLIHNSTIMDLMSAYATKENNHKEPINLFMATTIMSRPGMFKSIFYSSLNAHVTFRCS